MKDMEKSDMESLRIHKQSFISGYTNGFVQGYYLVYRWLVLITVILGLILIISLLS